MFVAGTCPVKDVGPVPRRGLAALKQVGVREDVESEVQFASAASETRAKTQAATTAARDASGTAAWATTLGPIRKVQPVTGSRTQARSSPYTHSSTPRSSSRTTRTGTEARPAARRCRARTGGRVGGSRAEQSGRYAKSDGPTERP